MGYQARHLLHNYWYPMAMVTHAGGYYSASFNGYRSVTQAGQLSPTILNMLVDTVVRQCILLAVDEEAALGVWWREIEMQALFFTWVMSQLPQHGLNGTRGVLMPLRNSGKTKKVVSMLFQTCRDFEKYVDTSYGQQMTGNRPTYPARQKQRVQ